MEKLWVTFIAQYHNYLLTLVGLVVADLIFGVASALKRKVFSLAVLSNFYRTNVIPKLLGWVALSVLTAAASPELLGSGAAYATPVVTVGAWGAIVLTMGSSIWANGKEVFGAGILPKPKITPE